MKAIGAIVHPTRPQAQRVLDELRRAAEAHGMQVVELLGEERLADPGPEPDVIVALGGDGTVLRAARVAASRNLPLLGINLGHLGFLSSADPGSLEATVDALAAGTFTIESHMMLSCVASHGGTRLIGIDALNEIVVERATPSRVVHLVVSVGTEELTTCTADGFIVATPTGSTAYSMSAGGPIVDPGLRVMILTPVCPHTPLWRAVVVGPEHPVVITVLDATAVLSADGQYVDGLPLGAQLRVRPRPEPLRIIRLSGSGFFLRLRERFPADFLPGGPSGPSGPAGPGG
ncbi:MAG: NAD(+)/NADH kinase [Actinomycetota bacterium]